MTNETTTRRTSPALVGQIDVFVRFLFMKFLIFMTIVVGLILIIGYFAKPTKEDIAMFEYGKKKALKRGIAWTVGELKEFSMNSPAKAGLEAGLSEMMDN